MSEPPRIDPSALDPALVEKYVRGGIPHCAALNIRVVALNSNSATFALPYNPDLVGDPLTGVLHGGAVTTLVDSVCGIAVFAALQRLEAIATLDLRIDYLRPAAAHKELYATAECYRLTRSIAFLRARAYHPDTPDEWVASCVSAFMIGSSEKAPISADAAVPGGQS